MRCNDFVGLMVLVACLGGCGGGESGGTSVELKSDGDGVSLASALATAKAGDVVSGIAIEKLAGESEYGAALRPLAESPFKRDLTFEVIAGENGKYMLRLDLVGLRYEMFNNIGSSLSGSLSIDPGEPGTYVLSTGRTPSAYQVTRLRIRDGVVVGAFPFARPDRSGSSYVVMPFIGVQRWQGDATKIDGTYNRFEVTRNAQGVGESKFAQVRIYDAGTAMDLCADPQPSAVAACPDGALRRYRVAREGDEWRATNTLDPGDQPRFRMATMSGQNVWVASDTPTTGPWTLQIGVAPATVQMRARAIGPMAGARWGMVIAGNGILQQQWISAAGTRGYSAVRERPVAGSGELASVDTGPFVLRGDGLILTLGAPNSATAGELSFAMLDSALPSRGTGVPSPIYQYKHGERPLLTYSGGMPAVDMAMMDVELSQPAFTGYLPVGYLGGESGPMYHERVSTVDAYDRRIVREELGSDAAYYAQVAEGFQRTWLSPGFIGGSSIMFDALYTRPSGSTRRFGYMQVPNSPTESAGILATRLNTVGAAGYCTVAGATPDVFSILLQKDLSRASRCEFVVREMPSVWTDVLAQLNAEGAEGFRPFMIGGFGDGAKHIYVRDLTQTSTFGFYEAPWDFSGLTTTAQRNSALLDRLNREGAGGGRRYVWSNYRPYLDRVPTMQLFSVAYDCTALPCQ